MIGNRDIFKSALSLLGQNLSAEESADLEDRAPYLLASFCSLVKGIDRAIRKAEGLAKQAVFSPVYLSLEKDFPLCERLVTPAAFYVGAMLMVDESPELSDALYDKYCDSISSLQGISECESISNKYWF